MLNSTKTRQSQQDIRKNSFEVLMTFNNSEEYATRAEKLKYMLSSEVLEDKRLFGSDTDNTGQGAIDVLQLRSRFESIRSYCFSEDDKQVTVLSEVRFSASKSDYQRPEEILWFIYRSLILQKTVYRCK